MEVSRERMVSRQRTGVTGVNTVEIAERKREANNTLGKVLQKIVDTEQVKSTACVDL